MHSIAQREEDRAPLRSSWLICIPLLSAHQQKLDSMSQAKEWTVCPVCDRASRTRPEHVVKGWVQERLPVNEVWGVGGTELRVVSVAPATTLSPVSNDG